jgi:hypothetical protein
MPKTDLVVSQNLSSIGPLYSRIIVKASNIAIDGNGGR